MPDAPADGTLVASDVALAVAIVATLPVLNATRLSDGVVWKFCPVIVTVAPGLPRLGVKLVTAGALPRPTVKMRVDVTVPLASATEIVPVVAPAGTVTVN